MKKIMLILLSSMLLFTACKKKQADMNPQLPQIKQKADDFNPELYKRKPQPRYDYRGFRFREPFLPLTGSNLVLRASNEVTVPSIESLTLKGIFKDKNTRMAILSGGGVSYVLQGSRLFDNRRRVVPGISGAIKSESVIMIDSSRRTVELKLRDKK